MGIELKLDIESTRAKIAALVAAYPELAEDDVLRADMIEGETDAFALIDDLIDMIAHTGSVIDAIKARRDEMKERSERFERRKDALRGFLKQLACDIGIKKAERPIATISLRPGQPKVVGSANPDLLPDDCVTITRTANLTKIRQFLAQGMAVDGYSLSNSETQLVVKFR